MKKIILIASTIFFIAGFFAGRLIISTAQIVKKEVVNEPMIEVRDGGYKFISPLLECENAPATGLNGMSRVRNEIKKYIEDRKAKGDLTDASVYFRDMNNGPWFGISESDPFSPASLLKLPVMMAYYKKSETDPSILTKKIKFDTGRQLLQQAFSPSKEIEKGKEYTIEELIERMIVYSDNAALVLLEENIDPAEIDKITIDLRVETATDATPPDYMSVRGYAGLFRILFNASYLRKSDSEKILETLSRIQFDQGLKRGIPKSVSVSHKFGERELPNGINQLHDCGIIYVPGNPYMLCVMTRGSDLRKLAESIAGISSITYHEVEARLKQ